MEIMTRLFTAQFLSAVRAVRGMGHGGDWVTVCNAVLRPEGQGAGAKTYCDIMEFHLGDTEYDWVVAELGYEHGELFLVFADRQGDVGGVGDVSG